MLLTRAAALTSDLDPEYERYDVIAAYAQERSRVTLLSAGRQGDMVRVTLSQTPALDLRLATFTDETCRPVWSAAASG